MITVEWIRRRERNKRTGKMRPVWDIRWWMGTRKFTRTVQGYVERRKLRRQWEKFQDDIKAGNVRVKYTLGALALLASIAMSGAVNSPRPASWSVQDGALVVTWTNLSTAHPWLVSYADSPGDWRWETNRLASTDGRLTVSRPMTEPVRFFRLWPAAP